MHGKPTFARYVTVVAAALEISADEAESRIDRERAEAALDAAFGAPGDAPLYPDPFEGAARLCFESIQRRPLPCDNKRVAWDCLLDVLSKYRWAPLDLDRKEIEEKLDEVGDGAVDVDQFFFWMRARLGAAQVQQYERRSSPTS